VTAVKFRQQGGKRPRTGQESHDQTIAKALKTETAFSSLKWQQLHTEGLKAGDFIHTEGEFFVLSAALGGKPGHRHVDCRFPLKRGGEQGVYWRLPPRQARGMDSQTTADTGMRWNFPD
jgi:hypothetical protein